MGEHQRRALTQAALVRKEAYELWEKEGRKDGRDVENWLTAEKAVRSQDAKN